MRAAGTVFLLAALAGVIVLAVRQGKRAEEGETGGAAREPSFAAVVEPGAGVGLRVLGEVPVFALTDDRGERFDSRRLAGKVWVADFMFTQCAEACPNMAARFQRIQRAVERDPQLRESVRLVSFSVDPERYSPEQLSSFARRYGAREGLWHFLTGDPGTVVELSEAAFLLGASERSEAELPTHSDRFCLVDRQGRLRGHYRPVGNDRELARLLRDIRRLVAETPLPVE